MPIFFETIFTKKPVIYGQDLFVKHEYTRQQQGKTKSPKGHCRSPEYN